MARQIDMETLARVRTDTGPVVEELLGSGMSLELIAVRMSDYLAGTNPSVQSLIRWKKGTSIPSRANGAALVHVYEDKFGSITCELWEKYK